MKQAQTHNLMRKLMLIGSGGALLQLGPCAADIVNQTVQTTVLSLFYTVVQTLLMNFLRI